jgi:hypothetical protein
MAAPPQPRPERQRSYHISRAAPVPDIVRAGFQQALLLLGLYLTAKPLIG